MIGRRLEYQSQKAVLLHMDANVRFLISLHMPSIERVEKLVPLRIRRLSMNDCHTRVNDTHYEIGVIRHFPEGNAPRLLEEELIEGGSPFDLDAFGFRLSSNVLLPGDVAFRRGNHDFQYDTVVNEQMDRNQLRVHEKALEIRNQLTSQGVFVEDYLRSLKPPTDEEARRGEHAVRFYLRYSSDFLSMRIEKLKVSLLPFDWRRNNTKVPFTCYIQLVIMNEIQGSRQFQRFEYNKKLFEASKRLHEVLFGGRIMPIQVKRFKSSFDDAIYRLPVGFRLQVQKACIFHHSITYQGLPLIVENLESLKTLKLLRPSMQSDEYEHQIIRNATRVIIAGTYEGVLEPLFPVVRGLQNREICIRQLNKDCLPAFYITMMDAWWHEGRQVGASLWMRTGNERIAREVLEVILKRCENSRRTERCITVPLSNSTTLEASCGPHREESWMLKMHIVKV